MSLAVSTPMRSRLPEPSLPNLISASRLVLAGAFPFVAARPTHALAAVGLAAATDVADGWLARRMHRETRAGAVLDGVADKVFVGAVLVTMVAQDKLAAYDVLLLATRELLELPVAARALIARDRRQEPRANLLGKLTTTLQLASISLALLELPYRPAAVLTAIAGIAAGISYGRRVLRGRP